jgi:hypothetical protein
MRCSTGADDAEVDVAGATVPDVRALDGEAGGADVPTLPGRLQADRSRQNSKLAHLNLMEVFIWNFAPGF